MEELKPCPFCGSSDVGFHYTSGRGRGNHMGFMIKCKKCGGAGELFYSRSGSPVSEAEESAAKSWNTRAEVAE